MSTKPLSCVVESQEVPLAVEFHRQDGRIHGFPYGHLLHFLHEANPDAELQPNAPAERFVISYATHDVTLRGWRMQSLVPLLATGRLTAIKAVEARYFELTKNTPFICEISIDRAS